MKIELICVGKRLPKGLEELIGTYQTRLRRWLTLEITVLPPAKAADPGRAVIDESNRLLRQVEDAFVVLLDETGRQFSSVELSEQFAGWRSEPKRLVFVIGGAHGVSDELKARADATWSLSKLVFPHELARLIVAEQLYRALTIEHNLPYHHQ